MSRLLRAKRGERACAQQRPDLCLRTPLSRARPRPARPRSAPPHPSHLYMGFAKHRELTSNLTRRIDIRVMHHTSQPSAMFGWTGNTQLNRALKRFSSNVCFEFSETNLLPSVGARDSANELKDMQTSHWKGAKDEWLQKTRGVELESELDIFSFYGLRYIPPEERNVLAVLERVSRARMHPHAHAHLLTLLPAPAHTPHCLRQGRRRGASAIQQVI